VLKSIGDQLRSDAAAQEACQVKRQRFSVLRKERFQLSDASCKKKKEDLFLKRY